MNGHTFIVSIFCILLALSPLWQGNIWSAEAREGSSPVQQPPHAELGDTKSKRADSMTTVESGTSYPTEQYLVGKGQGDLNKGKMVCQRVSELSARTDLAKQIRVMVKEHMVDRTRERSGREAEQDVELTREEIVQEYLQGVKIVERHIDEDNKTCSATAVMLKSQIHPTPAPGHLEPIPTIVR